MRTPTDALRSMVRYTALALGGEWEVRLSSEKGTFNRPYARVAQVPSIQMVNQGWAVSKLITTYSLLLYPTVGRTPDVSHLEAMRTADLMWTAFAGPGVGAPVIRPPVDSHRGRPYRVPLYDYDGVPLDGPHAFVDETRRDPRDFLHVESPPEVLTFTDPDDDRLYSLAANIRMSWLRSAAVLSGQPPVSDVPIAGAPRNG